MTGLATDLPPPERRRNLPALLILILALAALLVAASLMLAPFAGPIVLALVLTTVSQPVLQRLLRWFGEKRRALVAGITVLAVVVLLIAPLTWLAWSMVGQAREGIEYLRNNISTLHEKAEASSWYQKIREHEWVQAFWRNLERMEKPEPPAEGQAPPPEPQAAPPEPQAAPPQGGEGPGQAIPVVGRVAAALTGAAAGILKNVGEVVLKFFLMLFILFYFLKDGPQILHSFERAVPLEEEYKRRAIETFRMVSQSIIRGSLGTALVQGLAAGLAFLVVGIPAVFWGAMTALCALIPPLGTGLVTFPMAGILLLTGHWGKGLFLLAVAVVIASMDNVIRPLLMGKSLPLHPIWLLLSILGGLGLFGPMGLIYGPLVLVLLSTFLALFVQKEAAGNH